jgi:NADH-quinone oxidoreductase subunit H
MLASITIVFPEYWRGIHLPDLVPYVALAGTIGFILVLLPGLIMIERWGAAFIQDRSGPNRVGPRGALQSTADVVKLFFKEDIRPRAVDGRLYYLAPVIVVITAFAAGAVMPLGAFTFRHADGSLFEVPFTVGDVNIGFLYILAISSLQVYGVVLAGWSSNNKYSMLGGLRSAAQLISYELSMGLALLCVVLLAGSLKLSDIVTQQNTLPWPGAPEALRGCALSWYWLKSGIIPVVLYTIAMFAETNRAPFDLPEAESELVAGYHTEYSSMKFAMFFTAEYVSILIVSGLNAAMFWGGPLPPIAALGFIPGFAWFAIKVMIGVLVFIWVRFTIPRLRYDALMALGWKRMLPIGLVWLFGTAFVGLFTESPRVASADTQVQVERPERPGATGRGRRAGSARSPRGSRGSRGREGRAGRRRPGRAPASE